MESVTIETDAGTFRADTIGEAAKLARVAAREAAKETKLREASLAVARERAERHGYRLLCRLAEIRGGAVGWPNGWRWLKPDAPGTLSPCVADVRWPGCRVMIETEHGKAETAFFGSTCIDYLENGSGLCMAIVIETEKGERGTYAVGVADGVVGLASAPGLSAD